MKKRVIVILGASGLIGKATLTAAKTAFPEATVRGIARNTATLARDMSPAIELFDGDLTQPETLQEPFAGITDLVIAVSGQAGSFDRIEHTGVIEAARQAMTLGVRKIVHISGSSTPFAPPWFEAGQAKYKSEKALMQMRAPVVILRPSWLMETLPRMERNGRISLIGSGKSRVHWLALQDLVQIIIEVLQAGGKLNGAYTVLGPEAISIATAAEKYTVARQLAAKPARMPVFVARILSMMVRELRPVTDLFRVFENFDEASLPEARLPFTVPATTLDMWLKHGHADSPAKQP